MKIAYKIGMYQKGWNPVHMDNPYAMAIIGNNIRRGILSYPALTLCHVETVFGDEIGGVSFSSIESDIGDDGKTVRGGRFKHIQYSHDNRWIFLPWYFNNPLFGKTYKNEHEVYEECKSIEGCEYDNVGILGQGVRNNNIQDPNKYYCSEVVSDKLWGIGHLSPAELFLKHKKILEEIK